MRRYEGRRGPQLRVAGMADIAGHSPRRSRAAEAIGHRGPAFSARDRLRRVARNAAVVRIASGDAEGNAGAGRDPDSTLFLNCGQGALGWTLALASGRVVADTIAGGASDIPLEQFAVTG